MGTETGREVFGLDPKTSWGWLKETLSERIFMTLAEAYSLVLVGVLVEVGRKRELIKYNMKTAFVRSA